MNISRRIALTSIFLIPFYSRTYAGLQCQNYPGWRRCTVGVNVNVDTARQQLPHWCWAACIQGIFDFYGHNIRQEEIVRKVFGGDVDEAAMGPQIVEAIEGSWVDANGSSFDASATVLWDAQFGFGTPDAIVQAARELENGRPLILGALGHATMLTAMTYSGGPFGTRLEQVVIRDPWPGNPNRRPLSPQEAMMAQFLAKVEVD